LWLARATRAAEPGRADRFYPPFRRARAFAVFDNGGLLVQPYLTTRIPDSSYQAAYDMIPLAKKALKKK